MRGIHGGRETEVWRCSYTSLRTMMDTRQQRDCRIKLLARWLLPVPVPSVEAAAPQLTGLIKQSTPGNLINRLIKVPASGLIGRRRPNRCQLGTEFGGFGWYRGIVVS